MVKPKLTAGAAILDKNGTSRLVLTGTDLPLNGKVVVNGEGHTWSGDGKRNKKKDALLAKLKYSRLYNRPNYCWGHHNRRCHCRKC